MARFKTTPNDTSNAVPTTATVQTVGRHAAHAAHAANTENMARAPHTAQGNYNTTRRQVELPSAPSPSATGAFQVVSQSTSTSAKRMRSYHKQGGVKQKPSKAPKGVIAGIIVAAVIVAILLFVLISGLFGSSSGSQTPSDTEAATTAVQSSASATEGIEYHGRTYKAAQIEGGWALVSEAGGQQNIIYSLAGEPVSFVFYEGKFYIAENLNDGTWDIISYMPMDGATASQMLDKTGGAVTGTGTLESMGLSETNLELSNTSGGKTYISLL